MYQQNGKEAVPRNTLKRTGAFIFEQEPHFDVTKIVNILFLTRLQKKNIPFLSFLRNISMCCILRSRLLCVTAKKSVNFKNTYLTQRFLLLSPYDDDSSGEFLF